MTARPGVSIGSEYLLRRWLLGTVGVAQLALMAFPWFHWGDGRTVSGWGLIVRMVGNPLSTFSGVQPEIVVTFLAAISVVAMLVGFVAVWNAVFVGTAQACRWALIAGYVAGVAIGVLAIVLAASHGAEGFAGEIQPLMPIAAFLWILAAGIADSTRNRLPGAAAAAVPDPAEGVAREGAASGDAASGESDRRGTDPPSGS